MKNIANAVAILRMRSQLSASDQARLRAYSLIATGLRPTSFVRSVPVPSFASVLRQAMQRPSLTADRSQQAPASQPSPAVSDLIGEATGRYNLPPGLLASVIKAESGFNPRAVSPVGAKGLMQLMDGTARSLGVTDLFDPAQNIDGGARFLRQLLDRYGGDLHKALAAYNAGPGAVDRHGGVPPYQETQTYVSRILGYMATVRGEEKR